MLGRMRTLFNLLAGILFLVAHPVSGYLNRVHDRSVVIIPSIKVLTTTLPTRVGEYCGGDAPLSTPYLAAFHKREESALGCQAPSPSDAETQVIR